MAGGRRDITVDPPLRAASCCGADASSRSGQTDNFELATAERIEVLRGMFSALYGNAAGGVIQVFTKDGPPRPTFGATTLVGSYGSVTHRPDAGGTLGNFNYVVDGAHFRTDGYTDNQHTAAADGYAVLNYRLGFEQNTVHWRVREFASINNLLGRHYIGAVVVNTGNGRAFQPAPGRNSMLGLSASYAF